MYQLCQESQSVEAKTIITELLNSVICPQVLLWIQSLVEETERRAIYSYNDSQIAVSQSNSPSSKLNNSQEQLQTTVPDTAVSRMGRVLMNDKYSNSNPLQTYKRTQLFIVCSILHCCLGVWVKKFV